jgi:hypothetical protein
VTVGEGAFDHLLSSLLATRFGSGRPFRLSLHPVLLPLARSVLLVRALTGALHSRQALNWRAGRTC